jgi:hypothetical protein
MLDGHASIGTQPMEMEARTTKMVWFCEWWQSKNTGWALNQIHFEQQAYHQHRHGQKEKERAFGIFAEMEAAEGLESFSGVRLIM